MTTENDALALTQKISNHQTIESAQISFPQISQSQLAWLDIKEGLLSWRIWFLLAYQDIKLRYRRSLLGPFWITLSMAITVYTMGYLYSHLFHQPLQQYYPFLVAGMLSWSLISTIVLELTEGFIGADSFLKQIKLPYSLYIHRLVTRNILIFFHNILVIVPILVIYYTSVSINWHDLALIPGLLIIYLNGFTYGLVLSMIGSRYRDVMQIVKSLVQVIFFVTPVMWTPEILSPNKRFIVDLNPFYAFLEMVRAPLLGKLPTVNNFIMVLIISVLGIVSCFYFFRRYRARIVYWL